MQKHKFTEVLSREPRFDWWNSLNGRVHCSSFSMQVVMNK